MHRKVRNVPHFFCIFWLERDWAMQKGDGMSRYALDTVKIPTIRCLSFVYPSYILRLCIA